MAHTMQYAYRSLKQLGLVSGAPTFTPVASFVKPENAVKTYKYSPDGRYFASATSSSVQVLDAETAAVVADIPAKAVVEISFSPKGTQLSTWERQIKAEEGQPAHKNMRVWDVVSATEVASFAHKAIENWTFQYTEDETKALRIATNEVQVYDPSDFSKGVIDKVRLEGVSAFSLSRGANPNVALFVGEKKGLPASVRIYALSSLNYMTSSKSFFKADKCELKWNKHGSSLLLLTQTDVDKTGKSYYGETNLYLLTASGAFDGRVTLDKDGGISDVAWSPTGREFAVTYGYMPAKTVLMNERLQVVHDFGSLPRNTLLYNPQGRLLVIAGFGNLAGQVDIWDRKTLKKIAKIEAPNTSHCEWSPDGRFLMCATLSPRLRVDNGMRFFHYTGPLVHVESIVELYQASWRPADPEDFPFTGDAEEAPAPSSSVSAAPPVKAVAPAGAYRPPHARGTLTPSLYKREDEGGVAYDPSSSTSIYSNGNGRTSPTFGARSSRRTVPGLGGATDAPADGNGNENGRQRKGNKRDPAQGGERRQNNRRERNGDSAPASGTVTPKESAAAAAAAPAEAEEAAAPALSPEDKRRRALLKKLQQIAQIREKQQSGQTLELTQLKKLDTEQQIRGELAALDLA